ncbi:MAG: OB-fold nucleic acid binding domain-containing protein, partial [Pseudonocardiaceae bacterium]
VPLFQEQLMQMAIDVAGFTAGEADQLRQAMGSKRSGERMDRLRKRFYAGMAEFAITGETADAIWSKLAAFASFGFPESHSVSFAYLVYSSAWLKLHYPAAFCAALLNAQPMGFWSPATLVADAVRHGVTVLGPDVNASAAAATLLDGSIRLGVASVRTIGADLAVRIAAARPYKTLADVVRANALTTPQTEALATAGAFGCFGHNRRSDLWAAGAAAQSQPDRLAGIVIGDHAPELPEMTLVEVAVADLWATGIPLDSSLTQFVRGELDEQGVVTATALGALDDGVRVLVAGVVTHRQRPNTASGVTFVNLEDETGLINVICSRGVWIRYRQVAQSATAMLIRGRLEKADGVVNVVAERLEALELATT